eukprot:759530-Hanusia_phi.AAC.1
MLHRLNSSVTRNDDVNAQEKTMMESRADAVLLDRLQVQDQEEQERNGTSLHVSGETLALPTPSLSKFPSRAQDEEKMQI